jgi:peptide/nickel transport system permease protein
MLLFILRRFGMMCLTALVLTFIVFFLTNLAPNLEKLARSEGSVRMTDESVVSWLAENGFAQPVLVRYAEWLGIAPGWTYDNNGTINGRCISPDVPADIAPRFCGIAQGYWGFSTQFKRPVLELVGTALAHTGKLMFFVMLVMVPGSLIIGVLAGMREGSRLDRSLSAVSIVTTATPEYVSGVVFVALLASSAGFKIFNGSATSAAEDATFVNFTLPVMTIALYGIGYIARMTRASMTEVMTAQYIRTARLKGVSFRQIVLRHALRNALIAPFTVIMLQFPWLLNGVVVVESLFNYHGFGWTLVEAAGNNDIQLLLGLAVVSVFVVLVTQLISDIGYVFLNPRIRIS